MLRKTVIIQSISLHARPASVFVKTAQTFSCNIQVLYQHQLASAKSILAILSLNIHKNDEIELIADGIDESAAVTALTNLIHSNFNQV